MRTHDENIQQIYTPQIEEIASGCESVGVDINNNDDYYWETHKRRHKPSLFDKFIDRVGSLIFLSEKILFWFLVVIVTQVIYQIIKLFLF